MYVVYILECMDGSLYTGIATDLARRFREHQNGVGSRYTRSRGARRIVYSEICANRSAAGRREAYIKRLPRREKLGLIQRAAT